MSGFAVEIPAKRGFAPIRSTSRPALFAAGGLFSVALTLLDAQALQAQKQGASSWELGFYVLALLAALVYVRFVSKGVKSTARTSFQEVLASVKKTVEIFQCPRTEQQRPTRNQPPVNFWVVVALFTLVVTIFTSFVVLSFTAVSEAEDPVRVPFLDAPFKCDQDNLQPKTSRNWTWFIAAFGLSSGLCVVHPLQSGLILGF